MMSKLFNTLVVFFIFCSSANAQTIVPSNNGKETEVKISKLLKDKLKIKTQLKVTDNVGENIRLATVIENDKKKGIPKVAAFVDTKILSTDKEGNALSQVISIFSISEVKLKNKQRLKLLEWANSWNRNVLPIRVQVVDDKIIAASNLMTTKSNPISEESIIVAYIGIIQIWPTIIESLKKSNLLYK